VIRWCKTKQRTSLSLSLYLSLSLSLNACWCKCTTTIHHFTESEFESLPALHRTKNRSVDRGPQDWLFTVLRPAQEFFIFYGDVTIAGEGLLNLGLCSVLRAFEQEGIFIVSHLWHGASVFLVSSENIMKIWTKFRVYPMSPIQGSIHKICDNTNRNWERRQETVQRFLFFLKSSCLVIEVTNIVEKGVGSYTKATRLT
jgi:hypothetical protein